MRTPLLFVAASGLAREAAAAAWAGEQYEPIGFLDDNSDRHGSMLHGLPVLGGLEQLAGHPDAQVLLCAGKGTSRAALAQRLALDPARYATLLHPSVAVGAGSQIGAGSILLAGCTLTVDVQLGVHVVAMPNVTLTHDDRVEDFATLCAGVTLGGTVRVGRAAYLGMNSSVLQGRAIGTDAVLGMGAVALRDIPDGQTWVGVPARPHTTTQKVIGA